MSGRAAAALAAFGPMSAEDARVFLVRLFFGEYPNTDAATAAAALYGALSLAILGLTLKNRAWFMLTVVLTGACEVLGFGFRLSMVNRPEFNTYIVMQLFLIVPPVLLAIVEYTCVGRLLAASAAKAAAEQAQPAAGGKREPRVSHASLAKWTSRAFTASDILCLLIQGAGGALAGTGGDASRKAGNTIMLAGLSLQLVFFTAFTALTCHTHASPAHYGRVDWASPAGRRLRRLFGCLYATIALMYVRNIFRVIEFAQGYNGNLASHEVFFYGFDFAPIFSCFLLFAALHYGFLLPSAAEALGVGASAAGGGGGIPGIVELGEARKPGGGDADAATMIVVTADGGQ